MLQMAVNSDHVPNGVGPGQAGQLCRELKLTGVEPLLTLDSQGARATGVTLQADAAAIQVSASAATRFTEQVYDALANDLPLSVSVRELGEGTDAHTAFSAVCELLQLAGRDAGAPADRIDLIIAARALSPEVAWALRRDCLGAGAICLLPCEFDMRPDGPHDQRERSARFWSELWRAQHRGDIRAACATYVFPECRLLSAEAADSVQPVSAVQAPAKSAWLPIRLDVSGFADDEGALCHGALEHALHRCVEAGDLLHDLVRWPTASCRHDAWLNRRLAIELTGFGNLIEKRSLDPQRFASLQQLCEILHWIRETLRQQSRRVARRAGFLPAFEQADPSHALPSGHVRNGWRSRWRDAVEASASRHRNLIVISPWSVFPQQQPPDYRFADLLPILGFANACAFPRPPDLSHWTVSEFTFFHQRVRAVLQQRCAAHQIAEGI